MVGTETVVTDSEPVAVHVNVPRPLWTAIGKMAKVLGITKTNIIIRALNKEMYFNRIKVEHPDANVVVEYEDGMREVVSFV